MPQVFNTSKYEFIHGGILICPRKMENIIGDAKQKILGMQYFYRMC